jgi:hypothetical protein
MANEGVHVTGVPETVRALKQLDAKAARELIRSMKAISEYVIGKAQGRMEFGSGSAIAGSLKPGAGVRGAWIKFPRGGPDSGHDSDGFYPWLDFGGGLPMGRGVTASSPIAHKKSTGGFRRPKTVTGGRYIYPAIDDARQSGYIEKKAYEAFKKAGYAENFELRGF